MKKAIIAAVGAGLVAGAASAEVSTSLDFASAYVFRGVTYNDGPVFQPGVEASGLGLPEEMGGVSVGFWGNYDIDDYGGTLNSSEYSEIDWYFSYTLPSMVDGVDVSVGFCEYTYPNGGTADKEANIGVSYGIGDLGLGATAYFNVGGGDTDFYYELAAEYGVTISDAMSASVGATAGYADPENGDSGFSAGTLSAGVSYALNEVWSVGVSGTYIAQLDDSILADGKYGAGYDVDFVGMLSLGAEF